MHLVKNVKQKQDWPTSALIECAI